jgi:spore coat protein U-like protein
LLSPSPRAVHLDRLRWRLAADRNLAVTATVAASCLVVGPNTMAFGAYDPSDVNLTADRDAAGSIAIRCTKNTLATSSWAKAASGHRFELRHAAAPDASGTDAWATSCTATPVAPRSGLHRRTESTFTSANSATATVMTVYGRIPAGQNVAAGSYTDTVAINVTF